MTRRYFRARSVVLAVVCAIAVTAAVAYRIQNNATPQSPSLPEVLHVVQNPWQWRLFSGARAPSGRPLVSSDRAVEKMTPEFVGVENRYLTGKDRSSVDEKMQSDGVNQTSSESFYPSDSKDGARHPSASTRYKDDEKLVAQDLRRPDGTLQQKTRVTADGAKSVIDLAEDGITVIGETLYDPPPKCCGEGPQLKSEQRWLADAGHTLVYSDLTAADGKRTKSKFDANDHSVYWQMVCPDKSCNPGGLTLTVYYPHSRVKKLESNSTWTENEVSYYYETGKLWFREKIGPSSNDVTYFDADGVRPIFEQNFWRVDEVGADKAVKMTAKSVYVPFIITDFDGAGQQLNAFSFEDGKLENIDANGITIGGTYYKSLSVYIFPETGLLNWGVLFPGDGNTRVQVDNKNWTMPVLPHPKPEELTMVAPFIDEDLPVPVPRSQGYP